MMNKFNYAVYIGRFSPVHAGHINSMRVALGTADNIIIVLGSHNAPSTIKNPFTSKERAEMIRLALYDIDPRRIHFLFMQDFLYSDTAWATNVQGGVKAIAGSNATVGIIGNRKDDTSYYLNFFKKWEVIPCDCVNVGENALSATKIRELMFDGYLSLAKNVIDPNVFDYLTEFTKTDTFKILKKEYDDGIKYEKMYENVPYGYVNFVTVDAVVIQSGHILMIKRKQSPGAGLLALPGGHLGHNEHILDGCIRELREETGLKVPVKVLKGSIFHNEVFDHPERSLRARIKTKRGRTITHAYGFKLDDAQELPRIKASSDAESARWYTFDEITQMRDQIFEDHASIIDAMLGRLK